MNHILRRKAHPGEEVRVALLLSKTERMIINRLEIGPLLTTDPEGICSTTDSLKVMVVRLRRAGYPISTLRLNALQDEGNYRRGVYVLREDDQPEYNHYRIDRDIQEGLLSAIRNAKTLWSHYTIDEQIALPTFDVRQPFTGDLRLAR